MTFSNCFRGLLLAVALAGLYPLSGNAALLGLDSTGKFPDLTSNGTIDYSHDGSSGLFELDDSGIFLMSWAGATLTDFISATYDLNGTFDSSGNFTGGSVTVTGSSATADPLWSGPNILTATLTDFGFQGDGAAGVFEFEFSSATGDMTQFGHFSGGIIVTTVDLAGSGITATWDPGDDGQPGFFLQDFSGSANSVDTFVPVPPALWLFGTALAGLFGMRRATTGAAPE